MGNTSSGTSTLIPGALDSYVTELGGDIIYEKTLGHSRFLKSVRARHAHGPVAIKMYLKRDPNLNLRLYIRKLKSDREALSGIPNVYGYQSFLDTERAGYIIRQWLATNLYDRISTRPFLCSIEKRWIAFQILTGMKDASLKKVYHGDIKSENILLTSWDWVYITDFAPYKPVYLPEDDPADYSFYFDVSGRRTCNIAPERFFSGSITDAERNSGLTEAMDVFSVGCVIAELFMDGRDTFTLAQLLRYRSNELDVSTHLSSIEEEAVKAMVIHMLAINPDDRPSFQTVLDQWRDHVFPPSFNSFFHDYVHNVSQPSSSSPFIRPVPSKTPSASAAAIAAQALGASGREAWTTIPSDAESRIQTIWEDFANIEAMISETEQGSVAHSVDKGGPFTLRRVLTDTFPVEVALPRRDRGELNPAVKVPSPAEDGPAVIISSLICSNLRNCLHPSSVLKALDLMLSIAPHLTDESKLDRLAPYFVELLRDESSMVRAAALRTLTQTLMLVSVIHPSHVSFFPEYIFPNTQYLTKDPDVLVRAALAQSLVPLAETAVQFLEMAEAVRTHPAIRKQAEATMNDTAPTESYDTRLAEIQNLVEEQVSSLVVDGSAYVKRALLQNTPGLCIFFGRQKTSDVLLSHMITYLNDREWLLREIFFESIVAVAASIGSRRLEEYILPLLIQALSDPEEYVVAKVLSALTSLAELGMFKKLKIWELMSAATGFLMHPNIWIRQGSVAFLVSSAKHLPSTDVWCILYPSLRPLLRSDIQAISEQKLLFTLRTPIGRPVFDAFVQWSTRYQRSGYWGDRHVSTTVTSKADIIETARKGETAKKPKYLSPEDEEEFTRIRKLDPRGEGEDKIAFLRDYILKLSQAIKSSSARVPSSPKELLLAKQGSITLPQLGIVPRTVFLNDPDAQTAQSTPRRPDNFKRLGKIPESRTSRASSFDFGAARGEFKRRLGTAEGSVISLNQQLINDDARSPSLQSPGMSESEAPAVPSIPTHSASPLPPPSISGTDYSKDNPRIISRQSTTTSNDLQSADDSELRRAAYARPSRKAIRLGDRSKAEPAVGSINTVATAKGVIEVASKLRADLESDPGSGRASPAVPPSQVETTKEARERKSRVRFPPPAFMAYDGNDHAVTLALEQVYQDANRLGANDFGPRVNFSSARRRNQGRNAFSSSSQRKGKVTPSSSLISNLNAHNHAVNSIVVSADHVFFVSCSDDKTVKVWDTARIERNVTTQPRHTYTQHHAKVTCACMIHESHCFASAAIDGSLHVVRVHVNVSGSLPKYGKLETLREHRLDLVGEYVTSMHHFESENASTLVYTTSLSSIVLLDLRTTRIVLTLKNPVAHGQITCSCMDDVQHSWLLVGTQSGMVTLWDLRFGLKMRSWMVGTDDGDPQSRSVALQACVNEMVTLPSTSRRRQVAIAITPIDMVSSSTTIMETWDISGPTRTERFVVKTEDDGTNAPASQISIIPAQSHSPSVAVPIGRPLGHDRPETLSAADAIAALVRASDAQSLDQGDVKGKGRLHDPSASGHQDKTAGNRDDDADSVDSGIIHDPDLQASAIVAARRKYDAKALVVRTSANNTTPVRPPRSVSSGAPSLGRLAAINEHSQLHLISGTADRCIVYWDLREREHSFVMTGLEMGCDMTNFQTEPSEKDNARKVIWSRPSNDPASIVSARSSQRTSTLISESQQHLHRSHQDSVTALACLESPFRNCLISGDRAGVIKIFRIEE